MGCSELENEVELERTNLHNLAADYEDLNDTKDELHQEGEQRRRNQYCTEVLGLATMGLIPTIYGIHKLQDHPFIGLERPERITKKFMIHLGGQESGAFEPLSIQSIERWDIVEPAVSEATDTTETTTIQF